MRRLAKILLAILVTLMTVATVTLSTNVGQSGLLRLAASLSSDDTNAISIGELQGSLFGNGSIADVSISDKSGPWLKVSGISFSWKPSELIVGRLAVAYLRVDDVAMLRRPEGDTKPKETPKDSGFGLPLKIAVEELDIKEIDISENVAGEQVKLAVTASANIDDVHNASGGQLRVMRLDGPQGDLRADFAFVPADRSLEVEINGSEREGGIVSQLLGLPSRPPMSVQVVGKGTLDGWQADLSLAASGNPFLAGTVRLDVTSEDTHRFAAHVAGFIEPVIPRAAADLFAGKTQINVAADVTGLADGSLHSITGLRAGIASGGMRVAASGGIDFTKGFIHGGIEGKVGRDDGEPLNFIDGEGSAVSLRGISFRAALPDTRDAREVTATAQVSGIGHTQFAAETVELTVRASQLNADALDDIKMSLVASGVDETFGLGQAVGADPRATLIGAYDGKRLSIRSLDIEASGIAAQLSGAMEGERINASATLRISELSRLAGIADRPLTGRMEFDAKIDGNIKTQAISAIVLGKSSDLGIGIDAINGLLAPETKYSARIEHSADGTLSMRETSISNDLLVAKVNGSRPSGSLALSGNVTLTSLAAVRPDLSGKLQLDVEVSGPDNDLRSNVALAGESVTLNGKSFEKPSVTFVGQGPLSRHAGKFAMSGRIADEVLEGRATVVLSETGTVAIDDLILDIAGTKLGGSIAFRDALPSGQIKLDAQNLARLGNAIGMPLKGRVVADVALTAAEAQSVAKLNLAADNVVVGDLRIHSVRSTGNISNYLEAPVGAMNVSVSGISQGPKAIGGLSLDARFNGGATTFTSKGRINKGTFELSGSARTVDDTHEIEIASASYTGRSDLPAIRLPAPARISLRNNEVTTRGVRVAVADGALRLDGAAGSETLDLKIALERIPASLAGIVAPELGIVGSISGTAAIKGNASNPEVAAKIAAAGLSIAEMRSQQLPATDITTDVTAADGKAQVKMHAKARGGVEFTLGGTVGYKADGMLALSGRGTVPLTLANVFLADRATRIGGAATLTTEISGPLSAPRVDGRILVEGATASDAEFGLELAAINADVGFSQDSVIVRRLVAASKKGGNLTAEGTVLLRGEGGPTVNAAIKLAAFKFGNQDPVAGEIDGNVSITGPLQALIARGDLLIARMDITVPNRMPQSVSSLDIRHVNAPPRFQSAEPKDAKTSGAPSSGTPITLAVDVRANDRIFVRGRGVDAQLGGFVKVRGTAGNPFADGQFTMSRGKLAILGRQLDFSRGNIVFMGSLEPSLDMEAQASADGKIVIVKVTGPASKPQLAFTSSPELPEDEIVSLLLFNKQLATLSPAQLIQLAGEVDKIGGLSSGPGTFDKMKSAMGIDVLDVTTDEKGNAQATAGSYINDKTYIGVKQGMDLGKSRIVIDHNLTKNLKARGETGTDGKSKLGLGFEWDY